MDQRQKRMLQRRRRRIAGLLLLALMLILAAVGLLVHAHRSRNQTNDATFEGAKSDTTKVSMLASFPELGTDSIIYHDETVSEFQTKDTEAASDTAASSTSVSTQTSAGTTLHNFQTGDAYAYAYAGFTPHMADLDISDWQLLLVNRDYMLPQDYSPELAEAAKGTGVRMDARVAPYYQQMYDAAQADGITLTPLSGHRRISTQTRNFENKIQYYMNQGFDKATATQKAAEIILPPGTSEHNAGLSMDIISLDVSFENTKAFAWLQENAEEYGFILRYPKDKEDITKITYEPWHWRFVGKENAQRMNRHKQCLEEFVGAVG